MRQSPSVLVAGALHYDVLVRADRFPATDETLPGTGVDYACGGKGGNQAVAAALHGAPTRMIGQVGSDHQGTVLLENLERAGVDGSGIVVAHGMASGMSVAIVDRAGAYGAVIVSGANATLSPAGFEIPRSARVLLLQNEIPEATNLAFARQARAAGCRVVLNAAPARAFTTSLASEIELLIANQVEAAMLLGRGQSLAAGPHEIAAELAVVYGETIVTVGADGALHAAAASEPRHYEGHSVTVESTHGAGDAFVGALAARVAHGDDMDAALRYAVAAAALHVSRTPQGRRSIVPERVRELL